VADYNFRALPSTYNLLPYPRGLGLATLNYHIRYISLYFSVALILPLFSLPLVFMSLFGHLFVLVFLFVLFPLLHIVNYPLDGPMTHVLLRFSYEAFGAPRGFRNRP